MQLIKEDFVILIIVLTLTIVKVITTEFMNCWRI